MLLKSVLSSLVTFALCAPTSATATVLVDAGNLSGFRTSPAASGLVTLGDWSEAEGGLKISWSIFFDGTNWNYSYTFREKNGTPVSPQVSHWILEVSPFITSGNVSSYIFDTNFARVGPSTFTADPLSPNNGSAGGNGGNPNLPVNLYGIKLDSSQSTYTFKSTQAPMWGDLYIKDGSGTPATSGWNSSIGTDPTGSTTSFTGWIPVPDTLGVENCTDGIDNDADSLADCADPDCASQTCNDGLFCTVNDTCNAGTCGGAPRSCSDSVSCSADSCNEATDSCVNTTSNAACSDGQFCNGVEVCHPTNGCIAGSVVNCSDGVACTLDACNEATDQCDHVANSASCNDGQFCNGTETCHATNGCQAGTPVNCNDGVGCTNDTCNEMADQCDHVAIHASCSNGQFCDGAEICNPIAGCQAGAPVDCGDGISCTVDACNETTDACTHAPNHGACSNGQYCDGAEVCSSTHGCQAGTPVNCSDGVACTTDVCNETVDQCQHSGNYASCSNGLFCDGDESCHLTLGCQAGVPPNCNDAVGCTTDACNEAADQCDHTPSPVVCDDGLFCNGNETCDPSAGCQPGATPCGAMSCSEVLDQCVMCNTDAECDNGLFCDGAETCDPSTGTCTTGTPISCGDGVACTADVCNETLDQCVSTPNDGACDDGAFCNGTETCDIVSGCESGAAPLCSDGVDCTIDACNEATDQCDYTPNHGACHNGLFCDGPETCDPLDGCTSGTPVECGDGVGCTVDTCDEILNMCIRMPNHAACSDGVYCNGAEVCSPVDDCQAGIAVDCSDGVACTTDVCDESVDMCAHTANHAACDNGLYCDGDEVCDPVLDCSAGTPIDCDDGNGCSLDTCDEILDDCVEEDLCCGNGTIELGEQCEPPSGEICNNLIDDDGDGEYDCADLDCGATTCSEHCTLVAACQCIEEDPALILFARDPNYFKIHGRIKGDASTIDPQGDGFSVQLTNAFGVIYEAALPPNAFIKPTGGRFKYKQDLARNGMTGVCSDDPMLTCNTDLECAGANAGVCAARGLFQLALRFRVFEGVSYLTARVKAFGDFSLATESCMTTQFSTGDDAGALRTDWTKKGERAWLLRVNDYTCPEDGSVYGLCDGDVP